MVNYGNNVWTKMAVGSAKVSYRNTNKNVVDKLTMNAYKAASRKR